MDLVASPSRRPRVFDPRCLRWRPIEPSWSRGKREAIADDEANAPIAKNATRTVYFGIDQAQIGSSSSQYGTIEAIVKDLVELGVDMIRQPGPTDLYVAYVLLNRGVVGVPLAEKVSTSFVEDTVDDLKELLYQSCQYGLKVVLTIGTAGLGAKASLSSTDGRIQRAQNFPWSSAHLGEELNGNEFGYVHDGAEASDELDYLDTRDRYQWYWMVQNAREACRLLLDLEESVQVRDPSFVLEDVVRAIAIGNELDGVNVVESTEKDEAFGEDSWQRSSRNWAKLCYPVATAVHEELPRDIDIWLPGLSSYDVDEDELDAEARENGEGARNQIQYRFTWNWHINWLREFLGKFAELAAADGVTGTNLADIASAVDYHWYHRKAKSGTAMGPLHISRMVWEIEQIKSVLHDAGYTATRVTAFESGMSVLRGESSDSHSSGYDFVPDGLVGASDGSVTKYEVYQAFQVWRRLAGACAAGAVIGGWHALQGDHSGGDFYGCGLRTDAKGTGSKAAFRRWSWYCYQRFTQVFSAFQACSMVLPASADLPVNRYDESHGTKFPTSYELDAVVFEFTEVSADGRGWYNFAYLILVDTWRSSQGAEIVGKSEGSAPCDVIYVSTVPLSIQNGDSVDSGELPSGTAAFKDDVVRSGVTTITRRMNENSYPVLVLSSGRFAWEVVRTYNS